ncbi:MAG: four-carbon acid sugar kinase family protein, partial [Vulcanococcus sp.]|nr:four-carbon acid sugar kinase family protein [Vulcanococcus sp.]
MAERRKVIVIDDDPTGSQTVHSAPLLLRWDPDSLRRGLRHPSPLLFVLANTRALEPEAARERVREICRGLRLVLAELESAGELDRWLVVSRGDSTLRGHFPLEVDVISEELGPFDATLLVPAFLPGGRTTRGGVHYLHGEPVHTTDFARDRLFGFSSSFLPEWVAEKTGGAISPDAVERLDLAELDGPAANLQARVDSFSAQRVVAVDAERPEQLAALGEAVWRSERRLLFQSAASLINGLVPLPPQPLDAAGLAMLRRRDSSGEPLPVLVVVGSHVP